MKERAKDTVLVFLGSLGSVSFGSKRGREPFV